jgi:hypothetical protein
VASKDESKAEKHEIELTPLFDDELQQKSMNFWIDLLFDDELQEYSDWMLILSVVFTLNKSNIDSALMKKWI